MFSSLKKNFQGLMSKVSDIASNISESLNFSTSIGDRFRNTQMEEDLSSAKTKEKKLGLAGKNAKYLVELIAKASQESKATVRKSVELDPVGRHSGTYRNNITGQDAAFSALPEERLVRDIDAPKVMKISSSQGTECLMVTLDSGEVLKIQADGKNISLQMRSLNNGLGPITSRTLDKSKFAILYSAMQTSLNGDDSQLKELVASGAVTSTSQASVAAVDGMHPDAEKLVYDNTPELQASRRPERVKRALGLLKAA